MSEKLLKTDFNKSILCNVTDDTNCIYDLNNKNKSKYIEISVSSKIHGVSPDKNKFLVYDELNCSIYWYDVSEIDKLWEPKHYRQHYAENCDRFILGNDHIMMVDCYFSEIHLFHIKTQFTESFSIPDLVKQGPHNYSICFKPIGNEDHGICMENVGFYNYLIVTGKCSDTLYFYNLKEGSKLINRICLYPKIVYIESVIMSTTTNLLLCKGKDKDHDSAFVLVDFVKSKILHACHGTLPNFSSDSQYVIYVNKLCEVNYVSVFSIKEEKLIFVDLIGDAREIALDDHRLTVVFTTNSIKVFHIYKIYKPNHIQDEKFANGFLINTPKEIVVGKYTKAAKR